ncbi:Zinc finger MYM-type protein 1-like [Oopsacas minuta]|uniref:Zinc finger MYM-type protein 1-like n=1 Tax=Oopsacas minuta TaxID=111878 RepID=A0AAV7KC88_9METZ|nr:Zinc finger MYM-type protein 1-like [Oopsacas minuta]
MTGGHIDESLIEQYESENKYWHQVLQRTLSLIKMLSSGGLSFRGSDEIVGSVNNAKVLFSFLEENNVSIKDFRVQTYDNASNMSGKYNGMQALIHEKNKLAEFIPCCPHFLNLIGQSAVECCPAAVSIFYFVQKLYVFFSASTHRWDLLLDAFKKFGYQL